jgi:aminoglycoside 3-N-acetyltransferase I
MPKTDIKIQKLEAKDIDQFVELITIYEELFEMEDFKMPSKEYLQRVLERGDFWTFVAIAGKKVVGGLTAHLLVQYYTTTPQVYLYDLGVKEDFQRQGIGKALIAELKDFSKKHGIDEMYVQADLEDVLALDFYCATGAQPVQVVHFNYFLNEEI